jgi:hypothetical protein
MDDKTACTTRQNVLGGTFVRHADARRGILSFAAARMARHVGVSKSSVETTADLASLQFIFLGYLLFALIIIRTNVVFPSVHLDKTGFL